MLLVIPLLSGCGKSNSDEESVAEPVLQVEVTVAEKQKIRELLSLDGSYELSPGDYVRLAPTASGKLAKVFVKEGDRVKKGQILARIDTTVLDAQRSSASRGAASAEAQARQSEATLKASSVDFRATVKAAELNLQAVIAERDSNVAQANVELDKLRSGARPQEISQAEQSVRQAKVNRDKARSDADRDKQLLAEGYVSGQQAEASQAAFEVAESALIQAKEQLALTKLGARSEDIHAAELRYSAAKNLGDKRVEAAKASLEQARQGRLMLDAKAREVEAARLGASQKGSDTAAATALAANGEIRAPFDGTVVRRLLGPGDSADQTTPVLELVRKGATVEFSGHVSASKAGMIAESMSVLNGDDTNATGMVRSVGIVDAQSGQTPVRVVFTKFPERASAGAFSRLQVVLRTIPDAVTVPESAIVTREDKHVVFVIEGGTAKMQEVEVGPAESGRIAVMKGLRIGQKVVLVGQHELSDGAKIEEAKGEAGK
jgi:RND family efflux transporter MFP subunit